jgi:hypothetical protein
MPPLYCTKVIGACQRSRNGNVKIANLIGAAASVVFALALDVLATRLWRTSNGQG